MNLFKMNYNKLFNLKQLNFNLVIYGTIIFLGIVCLISFYIEVYQIDEFYGIYENNKLNVKISEKLSENIHDIDYIEFKNEKIKIKNIEFINYEIVDNSIFENIELEIDKKFLDNEIGKVKFYYGKQKLIKYIFDLFE